LKPGEFLAGDATGFARASADEERSGTAREIVPLKVTVDTEKEMAEESTLAVVRDTGTFSRRPLKLVLDTFGNRQIIVIAVIANKQLRHHRVIMGETEFRFRGSLYNGFGDCAAVAADICCPVLSDETGSDHDENVQFLTGQAADGADALLGLQEVFSGDEFDDCLAGDPEADDVSEESLGVGEGDLDEGRLLRAGAGHDYLLDFDAGVRLWVETVAHIFRKGIDVVIGLSEGSWGQIQVRFE
jgi:hypothetical protein